MTGSQRTFIILVTAAGLACIAGAGLVLWGPAAERWRRDRRGAAEEPFLQMLKSPDEGEQKRAAEKLGELRSPRAAAPLAEMLRAWGKSTVEAAGPAGLPAGIVEIHFSADVLAAIGPPAIPALVETLADEHEIVRLNAGHALEKIGAPAVPALAAALQAQELPVDVRANAGLALGRLGPAARDAAPALIGALRDSDARVRDAAVYALSRIGPESGPELREALEALTGDARESAEEILNRLDGETGDE